MDPNLWDDMAVIHDVITGHVYCTDDREDENCVQSVFPGPLSHMNKLHPNHQEAWDYISNVMEGFE